MQKQLRIIQTILVGLILVFTCNGASASEIFGRISTDPRNVNGSGDGQTGDGGKPGTVTESGVEPAQKLTGSSGLFPAVRHARETAESGNPAAKPVPAANPTAKNAPVNVLGITHYPDGSLLRGSDRRIYLIMQGKKSYIASLEELAKYRGRAILSVADADLAEISWNKRGDGDLIRERGTQRVFVIDNGLARPVYALKELREKYAGRDIHNLDREDMNTYF